MWTYAQSRALYASMPPASRAFWQNLYQRYTQWSDVNFGPPIYDSAPRSPVWFLHQSCMIRDYLGLPIGEPYFVTGDPLWQCAPDSPVSSWMFYDQAIADQFLAPELLSWYYPRPKYNVRRSYWTGVPRRRRNL